MSTLDAKGAPGIVQRTMVRPPSSRMGPAEPAERKAIMAASPVSGKYDAVIDRESAYEILEAKEAKATKEAEKLAAQEEKAKKELEKKKARTKTTSKSRRMTPLEKAGNQAARTASREFTRYILRGILGSMKR